MKVLIDADGCPVVDIAVRMAKENHLACLILCDTSHAFEKVGATTMTFSKGADSVDDETFKTKLAYLLKNKSNT